MIEFKKKLEILLIGQKAKVVIIIFLFLLSSCLEFIGIGLIGPYVALVTNTDSTFIKFIPYLNIMDFENDRINMVYFLSIILISIFIFKAFFIVFIYYFVARYGQDQMIRLRSLLMSSYQNLDYNIFLKRNSAEYVYNIIELTNRYATGVLVPLLKSFGEIILATAILILLIVQNPFVLIIFIFLIVSLIFFYDFLTKKKLKNLGLKADQSATEIVKAVNESMVGFKEVRVLGKENYFHNSLLKGARNYGNSVTLLNTLSAIPRYIFEVLIVLLMTVMIFISLEYSVLENNLFETLSIFGVAAIRLIPTTNIIISSITQVRFNKAAVDTLSNDIISLNDNKFIKFNEITSSSIKEEFKDLRLEDVNFKYPNTSQKALKNINLNIKAGTAVGLIGPSGSGKTTLVDLLLGLHKPQSGKIYFNDKVINENKFNLKTQVAYLPQEVFMLDATLAENITLSENLKDDNKERVESALKKAKLDQLINKLPDGIYTKIGERGVRLSGGQRQRLALARAFYHGRNILILDEATSALDNETENEIIKEIYNLKSSMTIIVIAHRLSTVKHCDIVYTIEDGKIISSSKPTNV